MTFWGFRICKRCHNFKRAPKPVGPFCKSVWIAKEKQHQSQGYPLRHEQHKRHKGSGAAKEQTEKGGPFTQREKKPVGNRNIQIKRNLKVLSFGNKRFK